MQWWFDGHCFLIHWNKRNSYWNSISLHCKRWYMQKICYWV